jgi:hypothetical protein
MTWKPFWKLRSVGNEYGEIAVNNKSSNSDDRADPIHMKWNNIKKKNIFLPYKFWLNSLLRA